jgi:aspartate oxidase
MNGIENLEVDVLVAGGGLGGLMAAFRARRAGARVAIALGSAGASARISSLNTALGRAPQDQPSGLFRDMFAAGGELADPAVLERLTQRIGQEVDELVNLGVGFHRVGGRLARRRGAGSSANWAVFSGGMIGHDICRVLSARLREAGPPQASLLTGARLVAIDAGTEGVRGGLVHCKRTGTWLDVRAPVIVLATGGAGALFDRTTNPPGSEGTGYSMALEAGAEVVGMEFISYEPFVTLSSAHGKSYDLPTTVLHQGARLRNSSGRQVISDTEVPSKDIICRTIVEEVDSGRGANGALLFDLREVPPATLAQYTGLTQALNAFGLTSENAVLPVFPAQHYMNGGVRITADGTTSVAGLLAVGEVAGGTHGAHRLAGAGGTEVVGMGAVVGDAAAKHAVDRRGLGGPRLAPRPELLPAGITPEEAEALRLARSALSSACGILRSGDELARASARLDELSAPLVATGRGRSYVGRRVVLASAIVRGALARQESRGDHFRVDFPQRDDLRWRGQLATRLQGQGQCLVTTFRSGAAPAVGVE